MNARILNKAALTALFTLTLVSSVVLAKGMHGPRGGPYFDPDTLMTVSGVLESTEGEWTAWGHGNHTGGGVHATLLADDGTPYELMLAPDWFLAEGGIVLVDGDRVTVTGSLVEPYGQQAWKGHGGGHGSGGMGPGGANADPETDFLIVTVLEAGGVELVLRNEDGYPVWRGDPAWHGETWFDPTTVTTLTGTLGQTLGMWSAWGYGNHTGNGMHYQFDSDGGESFYLMLGPWWFLEQNGIELEPGLDLEVTGSIVEPYWDGYDDLRYLIASEVAVGDVRVELRDEDGYPLWPGTGWHYYAPQWTSAQKAVVGEVRRTQTRTHGANLDPGYEVLVRSGNRVYVGYLAPQWYAEARGLSLAKGDVVEMRGAYTRQNGRHELVVRSVVANGRTYRLRNAQGTPLWVHGAR